MRRLGARLERVEATATRRGLMKTITLGDLLMRVANEDAESYSLVKASVAHLREQPDAENREAVERQIEELEEEKERTGGGVILRDPPPDPRKPRTAKKPIYARWWFWGGVAAVAGAGTGTYLLTRDGSVPTTDLGNVVFD